MKIGLLWHSFNSGNLGVGALSLSNMFLIENEAKKLGINPDFLLIGSSGPCNYQPDKEVHRHSFIEFSEKNIFKNPINLYKAINSCDVIFDIGEGDSFSDIYGPKRLIKLLLSKIMAVLGRTPIILSPQTIGPFNSNWSRYLSSLVMNKCDKVIARDKLSFSILEELNIHSSSEAIDVAFNLPYDEHKYQLKKNKLAIGISVSALLYHGGYKGKNNQFALKADYKQLTYELIEKLLELDYEVHLISHVIPHNCVEEDDYSLALELQKKYQKIKTAPRFDGPIDAKSYIASLDFFIGARMHATIGAFSSGIPVVPLAYSRKFSGLYESINYHHSIDLKEEEIDKVMMKILNKIEHKTQLKEEIRLSKEIIDTKLNNYKIDIKEILTKISKK